MTSTLFADIHTHPDLKTYLSADDEISRQDCWQNFNPTPIVQVADRILLGRIMESQCSLTQLNTTPGTIAMAGLYGMEKTMVKADLFHFLGIHVSLITVAKVLRIMGHDHLLNYDLLKRIRRRYTRYYSLLSESLSHLLLAEQINPGFKLLNSFREYDSTKLNIILTIEGGHNLFRKSCGLFSRRRVLDNLREIKAYRYRFLFMGLTHLERNKLCTHAFGIKFLKHRNFKPVGAGISELGNKVIKLALENPKRILIDIKHMSLLSRKQYFNMLDADYRTDKIPVIASHVGVTGVSYRDMPVVSCHRWCRWTKVLYFQPQGLMDTRFNPWSINLYDEEIVSIINSEGLIGLSLDARILGAKQKKRKELFEYFSRREMRCSDLTTHSINISLETPQHNDIIGQYYKLQDEIEVKLKEYIRRLFRQPRRFRELEPMENEILGQYKKLVALEGTNELISHMQNEEELHMRHLCNNILHIVKVGGVKGWKHICIGSDFDGLVSSIKYCLNATEYTKLSDGLKKWLPRMAATDPGFPPIANINQTVDDIMSGNVRDFLSTNLI